MSDHYEVLGVSPAAPESVIRAAYRARMREAHPDAGGSDALAQDLNEALRVLTSADLRSAFDASRLLAPEPPAPYTDGSLASTAPARTPEPFAASPDPIQPPRSLVVIAAATALCAALIGVLVCAIIRDWERFPFTLLMVVLVVCAGIGKLPLRPAHRLGMLGAGVLALIAAQDGADTAAAVSGYASFVLSAAAAALLWWSSSRSQDAHAIAMADAFWEGANAPELEPWFIESSDPTGASTRTLLVHVLTEERATRTLWGHRTAGEFVILSASHDEPVVSVPGLLMARASKVRRRLARAERRRRG